MADAWSRIEYGVIQDRSRDGLGRTLRWTTDDLAAARWYAVALAVAEEMPIEVKQRTVVTSDWQRIAGEEAVS